MASSSQLRQWWAPYRCAPAKMPRLAFPGVNRTWNLRVAEESIPLWQRFIEVMDRYDYKFRESAGGTYNCRKIAGTNSWSLHAYGIALDLNPSVNCYGCTTNDYPPGFIDDILAIETNGKRAFTFGGFWSNKDQMHWQVNVAPGDIEENDVAAMQVEDLQEALNAAGQKDQNGDALVVDGIYGSKTKYALTNGLKTGAIGTHDHDGRYLKDVSGVK